MTTTTVFPFRATYKKSPRARKSVELVFFAPTPKAALENLLRIVREETTEGVPGFVDALTCAEAKAAGVPFAVEGDDSGACHRCRAPLGASQYTPNGADMPAFCSFECYMQGRDMDREGRPLSRREAIRGPSNFAVIERVDGATGRHEMHGVFVTLDEARGCVAFDRLTDYEIWQGDHIVEENSPSVPRVREQGLCPHCHGTTFQGGMRSGDDCPTCGGVGTIARG